MNRELNSKSMKKIQIITVFSTVLLLAACGQDTKKITTETAIPVTVSGELTTSNKDYVAASGKIEAVSSANVSTRMMGYVTKVHVKMGQRVAAGQLLVRINNTDLQAKKAQVEASILQANAAFQNAKKDFERFQNLFQQQSASQKELDDMTSRYEMAKAGLEGAKQMRNEVMAQFNYANITAPFAGEITGTFVKEGDMANPGMPLVSIEGGKALQITAMVAENAIDQIHNGMKATVQVKSLNKTVAGTVTEVSASAKNTGGQYLVKINLNTQEASLKSGMFAHVQFPVAPKATPTQTQSVVVPESALVRQGQLIGIYTVSDQKRAVLRWIRIGKTFGNQVEVLSGLTANEPYIVSAQGRLYNGVPVTVH
jgi:RND family efflux transporter MFP subunit